MAQHLDKQILRPKCLVPNSFPLTEMNSFLKGEFISDFIFLSLTKARSVCILFLCVSILRAEGAAGGFWPGQ